MRFLRQSEQGVSLIELLVAVAILAIALTPLLSIFLHGLKVSDRAKKMTIANNLARDLMEEIRSQPFWDPDISNTESLATQYWPAIKNEKLSDNPNPTNNQPVGLELSGMTTPDGVAFSSTIIDTYSTSASRINSFDDVDDYDGWCRGEDCVDCVDTVNNNGLCADNQPLETFDGRKYDGSGGLPDYRGLFTRQVKVFSVFPNVQQITPQTIQVGYDTSGANRELERFKFFDLREENFPNLTSDAIWGSARGRSSLKVIQVTVEYNGNVGAPFTVEDQSLAVLQATE
jgi:prepilin-type N-terminal cleavage/methylation domain-containing protein